LLKTDCPPAESTPITYEDDTIPVIDGVQYPLQVWVTLKVLKTELLEVE
jgi:hypothetical protein